MYNENIIDCAVSEDYEFVHFGVPMVLPYFDNGHCYAFDMRLLKPEKI